MFSWSFIQAKESLALAFISICHPLKWDFTSSKVSCFSLDLVFFGFYLLVVLF